MVRNGMITAFKLKYWSDSLVDLSAHAVGRIFWLHRVSEIARYLSLSAYKSLAPNLPPAKKVAVTVEPTTTN